jgi:hypothetical protein
MSWPWSNVGQPGPSPRKHHEPPLMTHFGQLWSTRDTLGQNTSQNPLKPIWPSLVTRNFCRVLQISPKHFKFSNYRSCVVWWGTQLSSWAAFEIWSATLWKSLVNTPSYYSSAPRNSASWHEIMHKWLRKTPYALCKSCRGMGDLQLSYSSLGPLLFQNLEKITFEQGQIKFKIESPVPHARRRPRRVVPVHVGRRRTSPYRTPRPARVRWTERNAGYSCAWRSAGPWPVPRAVLTHASVRTAFHHWSVGQRTSPPSPPPILRLMWPPCTWVVTPSPRHTRL